MKTLSWQYRVALACALLVVRGLPAGAYTYNSSFGSEGTGNGQFKHPVDLLITTRNGTNHLYVLDCLNYRVQYFTMDGTYQGQWGSQGTGDGYFESPTGVTTFGDYVWVADTHKCTVERLSKDGVYQSKLGVLQGGSGDGQFYGPVAVAFHIGVAGQPSYIYVLDSFNNRVQKFDASGTYLTQWGSGGSGNGQFSYAQDIAVDTNGNVFVLDSGNSRVQKFNSSGTYQSQFGSAGTGDGQFDSPGGLYVDSSGNIWVADSGNHRIQKFTSGGSLDTKFGSQGSGNGQFQRPTAVVLDASGNVYVTDSGNHRVQKWVP